jgi:release factor glutamine methyltransferase
MTTVKSYISNIQSQLTAVYPADEAEALAWWIAEETTGLSRTQLQFGHKGTTNFPNVQEIIARLLRFEPIQYIFGHTEWYGLDLKVTPATLIPRPETAELVDAVRAKAEEIEAEKLSPMPINHSPLHVLDIGTGSGCIAIALKKQHPEWCVTGIDISPEAISIAKENAVRNNVELDFQVADIFDFSAKEEHDSSGFNGTFDMVVSNPPYICNKEKASMRRNVLDYEPASALFVPDDDPLLFYRHIASLRLGKYLFFEINEAYSSELYAMLEGLSYTDIRIIHDIYGKPRIIESRVS